LSVLLGLQEIPEDAWGQFDELYLGIATDDRDHWEYGAELRLDYS
jgi:hypothetical protein